MNHLDEMEKTFDDVCTAENTAIGNPMCATNLADMTD
jgi:hypothetical protein|tara:strand:- start:372 stop:482 length:111 start_codon:yes stop_codon:yes gene_type:complete